MTVRLFLIAAALLTLTGASLPETGPLPQARPEIVEQPAKVVVKSGTEAVTSRLKEMQGPQKPALQDTPEPVLTIAPESDADHAICIEALGRIGATFTAAPRIDDGKGCGIDKPLTLTGVVPGVALEPEGTMRCETALALARWMRDAVLPAAGAALAGEGPLTTIHQASSYVCRLRNNAATGKISEHARGNAIDIAAFTFRSGTTIEIQPRDEDGTLSGAFQRAVTATGCLYFNTVLDPGSDEAHETHLHFDVLQRRGGYRYCR